MQRGWHLLAAVRIGPRLSRESALPRLLRLSLMLARPRVRVLSRKARARAQRRVRAGLAWRPRLPRRLVVCWLVRVRPASGAA